LLLIKYVIVYSFHNNSFFLTNSVD